MIEIEANKYAITDDNWCLLSQNYYVKVSRTVQGTARRGVREEGTEKRGMNLFSENMTRTASVKFIDVRFTLI